MLLRSRPTVALFILIITPMCVFAQHQQHSSSPPPPPPPAHVSTPPPPAPSHDPTPSSSSTHTPATSSPSPSHSSNTLPANSNHIPTTVPALETATLGSAARILSAPNRPEIGAEEAKHKKPPSDEMKALRHFFPSILLPTPGFQPMPGAGSNDLSWSEDDDSPTAPTLPPMASPPVYQPGPGEKLPAPKSPATIVIFVPADARIWFDDGPTHMTGTERLFESPGLMPGKSYQYEVKARWLEDGKAVERTRSIMVRPGHRTIVDFRNDPVP